MGLPAQPEQRSCGRYTVVSEVIRDRGHFYVTLFSVYAITVVHEHVKVWRIILETQLIKAGSLKRIKPSNDQRETKETRKKFFSKKKFPP
jgi:hypothetical protein